MQPSVQSQNDYSGQRVWQINQHGKQKPLCEVLSQALGCQLEHVTEYDNHRLGTFTRVVVSSGSQLEAERSVPMHVPVWRMPAC